MQDIEYIRNYVKIHTKENSQIELAEKMGISPQDIGDFKASRKTYSFEKLQRLAIILELSIADMVILGGASLKIKTLKKIGIEMDATIENIFSQINELKNQVNDIKKNCPHCLNGQPEKKGIFESDKKRATEET